MWSKIARPLLYRFHLKLKLQQSVSCGEVSRWRRLCFIWIVTLAIFGCSTDSAIPNKNHIDNTAKLTGPELLNFSISPFIVVDQFGYLPPSQKVAVIRSPIQGFDNGFHFKPGSLYQLVALNSGEIIFRGKPELWSAGEVAKASGDKAWWFDFSAVRAPGSYVVVDVHNKIRSAEVRIGVDAYKRVLKDAVRTFYYQRAGFAKVEPYADKGWTDGASHLKIGQDQNARL